jgi:hypothetical protein
MMPNNLLLRIAEQQYLNPPELPRCPVCGSIDISAGGVCQHCNYELEVIYEKHQNVS